MSVNKWWLWAAQNRPPQKEFTSDNLYQLWYDRLLLTALNTFEIDGLPDTINPDFVKLCMVMFGGAMFFKDDDENIRALPWDYSGEPKADFVPVKCLLVSSYLGSYERTRGIDCEPIYLQETDYFRLTFGLHDYIATRAMMLAENEVSLNIAQLNTRLTAAVTAESDTAVQSAEMALNAMYKGKKATCIKKTPGLNIDTLDIVKNGKGDNTYTQLMELQQFYKGNYLNTLGINNPWNIKREYVSDGENIVNDDYTKFNVESFKRCVEKCVEKVNKMFDLSISFKFYTLQDKTQVAEKDGEQNDDNIQNVGTE